MKNQLSSGDWSLVIISNNKDGTQVAYERDFALSVGPQSTVTVGYFFSKIRMRH